MSANRPDTSAASTPATDGGPCQKCGGKGVSTSYHPRRSYCDPYSRFTHNTQDGEHLHRYCLTCHYDWTEDCADAAA